MSSIDQTMIRAILPEILMVGLILIVLAFDLVWHEDQKRRLGWLSAGGLVVIIILTLIFSRPGETPVEVWGGMLRFDWLGFAFSFLFMFGAMITCLFSMDIKQIG